jgi:hypothetical protein
MLIPPSPLIVDEWLNAADPGVESVSVSAIRSEAGKPPLSRRRVASIVLAAAAVLLLVGLLLLANPR